MFELLINNSYWLSPATATRARTGLPALTANYTGNSTTWSRQAITSGPGTTWRITQTDETYDVNTGLPLFTYNHGDVSQPAQATCTATSYAPFNTAKNLVGLVAEVEVLAKPCGGQSSNGGSAPTPAQTNALTAPTSVNRPTDVVANSRTFYDNPTLAQTWPQPAAPTWPQPAPVRGDVSVVQAASAYSGGYTYKTAAATLYDAYGRPTSVYDPAGSKVTTSFTPVTGLPTKVEVTNPLGHKASTTLQTRRGLAVGTSDPNNITTTARYDALGRLTEGWIAGRDPATKPADVKYSYLLSNATTSAVQTNKLNESDAYITSYVIYDSLMRESQTQVSSPLGGRLLTNILYDSHGWAYEKYNVYWDSDSNHFPGPDLVKSPMNQVRNHTRITFDGLGRGILAQSMDRDQVITSTTTVHNGDRTTVIPPSGATTSSTVTDALGRTTALHQYTAAPQLTVPNNTFTGIYRVTGGTQQTTQFTFDNKGRPHQRVDTAGNTWTTSYNLLGQVVTQADPDAGTSTTTYDDAGRVASTTDARGEQLTYSYDALGRKKTQRLSDGTTLASWTYDSEGVTPALPNSIGKMTSSSSYVQQSGTSYAYTQKSTLGFTKYGQPLDTTTVVPSNEGALAGTYTFKHYYGDSISLPTRTIYPAHGGLPFEPVGVSYAGALDLLSGIGGLTGYQNQILYDGFGRPAEIHLNAAKVSVLRQRYDDHDSRLLETWLMRAEGTPLEVERTNFGYDPAGNVTRETKTRFASASETQCYNYDALVRLRTAWTATDGCTTQPSANNGATVGTGLTDGTAYWTDWDLDPIGNRTKQTQHGLGGAADTVTTYTYPPSGAGSVRPHALLSTSTTGPGANTASYTYDNAGNTKTRVLPGGTQDLTWSPTGKLTTVTAPGQTTNYVYDADGNQLLRRDPGATTLFLHNTELTLNTSANTVSGKRFYNLTGGAQAIRTGTSTSYKYELSTRHGTGDLALDNTAQTPTWRANTPYGQPRGTQPLDTTWPDTHRFLDKPHSTTTGLTDIGARKYDQDTGRFISVDPLMALGNPQSWNGYAYANNNAITFSDPTGLYQECGSECGIEGPGWATSPKTFQATNDRRRRANVAERERRKSQPTSHSAPSTMPTNYGEWLAATEYGRKNGGGSCLECEVIVGALEYVAPAMLGTAQTVTADIAGCGNYDAISCLNLGQLLTPMGWWRMAVRGVLDSEPLPSPAGSNSGPWMHGVEEVSPGGAVAQSSPVSCVSACGEMLTNGARLQEELIAKIGKPSNAERLGAELGPGWDGGLVASGEQAVAFAQRGTIGAQLQAPGSLGHMVVISPIPGKGRFAVRDPWAGGATYEVGPAWIDTWVVGVVFRTE